MMYALRLIVATLLAIIAMPFALLVDTLLLLADWIGEE